MRKNVIIIAEAGVNHNGSLAKAIDLVEAAYKAKADYVKFQTFKTELNISKGANKANYQNKNVGEEKSQYEMIKELELTFDEFLIIEEKCKELGIGFLSTGFDIPSINFLDSLKPDLFKIPSGEITNKPYLKHIAKKNKPVILSTGMANISEIKEAVTVLVDAGLDKSNLTVLHCNTEYPTPMEDVNLKAMLHIQDQLDVEIGYSDHTLGIEVPIAAVALGAKVIEKHYTLDRNLPGPDHKASLEPDELEAMVKSIRNIELAISGSGIKAPSKSEMPNKAIARKSVHTLNALEKGHILQESDLIMRRPGDGISPMDLDQIIGKKLKSDVEADLKLSIEHLE